MNGVTVSFLRRKLIGCNSDENLDRSAPLVCVCSEVFDLSWIQDSEQSLRDWKPVWTVNRLVWALPSNKANPLGSKNWTFLPSGTWMWLEGATSVKKLSPAAPCSVEDLRKLCFSFLWWDGRRGNSTTCSRKYHYCSAHHLQMFK